MSVLIVGAGGMLGHQLVAELRGTDEVLAVVRRPAPDLGIPCLSVDLRDPNPLLARIASARPSLVINAAGVVKQRQVDPAELWEVNARFPHRLAAACAQAGSHLIHLSTDCVFSGAKGGYREADSPDPVDDYGRSKRDGEPAGDHVMVIRTSMLGIERTNFLGLVEWFLSQQGEIEGFTRAIFNGLTTIALGRLIRRHCAKQGFCAGLWHIGTAPISKFDLLTRLARALGRQDLAIRPSPRVQCDRSLDFTRYAGETGYEPPAWNDMIDELAAQIERRNRIQRRGQA